MVGSCEALLKYAMVSLIWGIAVSDFMFLTERNTGAICPPGWYIERMVPIAQLITVACDASVLFVFKDVTLLLSLSERFVLTRLSSRKTLASSKSLSDSMTFVALTIAATKLSRSW